MHMCRYLSHVQTWHNEVRAKLYKVRVQLIGFSMEGTLVSSGMHRGVG